MTLISTKTRGGDSPGAWRGPCWHQQTHDQTSRNQEHQRAMPPLWSTLSRKSLCFLNTLTQSCHSDSRRWARHAASSAGSADRISLRCGPARASVCNLSMPARSACHPIGTWQFGGGGRCGGSCSGGETMERKENKHSITGRKEAAWLSWEMKMGGARGNKWTVFCVTSDNYG
jgi:hypothetical protein